MKMIRPTNSTMNCTIRDSLGLLGASYCKGRGSGFNSCMKDILSQDLNRDTGVPPVLVASYLGDFDILLALFFIRSVSRTAGTAVSPIAPWTRCLDARALCRDDPVRKIFWRTDVSF